MNVDDFVPDFDAYVYYVLKLKSSKLIFKSKLLKSGVRLYCNVESNCLYLITVAGKLFASFDIVREDVVKVTSRFLIYTGGITL